MPSSRPARGRARPRPRAQARPCQALLPNETTSCPSQADGRGRFCAAHGREYGQLTKRYKDASDRVDALEEEFQYTMERADALDGTAALDAAEALASRFFDALGDEIEGRETHHKRFFQTSECSWWRDMGLDWLIVTPGVSSPSSDSADESHEKWLKRRRAQEAAAVRLIERLRKRREEVVVTEAAAKREEVRRVEETESLAQRIAIEKARLRAIEVAQLQATDAAQHRAIEERAREQAIEDAPTWSIAEPQRMTAQVRGVMGERTNIASRNQNLDVELKLDCPRIWTSDTVAPPALPPRPLYQTPQYPSPAHRTYYSPRPHDVHSTGEPRPPMRSASTTGIPVSATGPISSRSVDIERQIAPVASKSWQTYPERPPPRHEDSLDCSFVRTALFWAATFFVFCYLVVVDGLQRGYRLVMG